MVCYLVLSTHILGKWNTTSHRKYGVVMRGGITRFESGTASNNFGVLLSVSENSNMLATFPHR